MPSDLPTGTVTFLFTDVEGSTRLLHELGAEGYAAALAEHRRVIREACARHDGVEVDTQGDAFFFAFPTGPGALSAAGEMTEALASGQVQVRIGLHTGTPLLTEEGYVGDDVHFAARVAASSHGGQVVLSGATAELVELSLTDLGEHRLKDIEQAVSIFQLGDGSFPPLKTISNTNLPRPASSFVGREAELAEVLARIEGGARLVTLTGPGGSGKTRLALEAASSLVPEYKAGVFWVGLAALRDSALVLETVSQTLGAKDGLAEHIRERELLLLLDNLEQVIAAAPELSALLSSCPNLTLLVTSRELLRVQGEVEYPVPPLAEPEAVSLFCERAQVPPSAEIAELTTRLDSLPLAVELAAARVKALSPAQILERLSQRLDLLKGGRDADPRQQTLRATIEWSYDLLSDQEKDLFARLSVFAGGCTLENAEGVAGADLDTLQSLLDKSLLRRRDTDFRPRYWMLETIRAFAAERLAESGKAPELRRRHAEWLVSLAETAFPAFYTADQEAWLDRFDQERDNVRLALGWASEEDVELALSLAAPLGRFWITRGATEGLRWLMQALERAETAPPGVRASAYRTAAALAYTTDDLDGAQTLLEQSLSLFRDLGERAAAADVLSRLGGTLTAKGELNEARQLLEEAVATCRELGDQYELMRALGRLGVLEQRQGNTARATELFEESLALGRAFGDAWWAAGMVGRLAEIALLEGAEERARELARESLAASYGIGDRIGSLWSLGMLACVAARRGLVERAGRLWGAVDRLEEELGKTPWDHHRPVYEALLGDVCDPDFARGREAGRSLGLDEAVAYALESLGLD